MNPPAGLWNSNPVIGPDGAPDSRQEQSQQPLQQPETAATATRERRQFPRRDSHCMVAIVRHAGGVMPPPSRIDWEMRASRLRGDLLDISMNAAAFLLPEPLAAEETLSLRIRNQRSDQSIDTTARVLRAIPDAEGQWKIVCRILQNLSVEQLHCFGYQLFNSHVV